MSLYQRPLALLNLLILPSLVFILFGCQNSTHQDARIHPDGTTHFSGHLMTMDYHIIIGKALAQQQISAIETLIEGTFKEIDSTYNKWNADSELSRLNRLKSGQEVMISSDMEAFLTQTQMIVEITEGRFDPTIEPLQALWKAKLKEGSIPTEAQISAIAPAIGWHNLVFGNGTFKKLHDLTAMDLGGIAKGFCVDRLVEKLNDEGCQDVYVEWGGEIRCSGSHPQGRPWTICISRLGDQAPSRAVATLPLENSAIATSGDYFQHWAVHVRGQGEQIFFHIFDPKTLKPLQSSATSVASASVIAPSCALADGLATAAMMFPTLDLAKAWTIQMQQIYPDLSFWLISRKASTTE